MTGFETPSRIALDFDGVVIESVQVKNDAFRDLFAGLPETSKIYDYLDANSGLSRYVKFAHIVKTIMRRPYAPADEAKLDADFSGRILTKVLASRFVDGAEDFLAWCPLPIDVVSAMPLTELKIIVEKRGLKNRFQELHGTPGKKSEQLRGILSSRALSGNKLLFVGDSAEDLTAALEAGVRFVGRVNPENPASFPAPRVKDMSELRDMLEPLLASEPR